MELEITNNIYHQMIYYPKFYFELIYIKHDLCDGKQYVWEIFNNILDKLQKYLPETLASVGNCSFSYCIIWPIIPCFFIRRF